MRKLFTRSALVAGLLAIPALAWNGDETAKLRERWLSTLDSIAKFTQLGQRVAARDTSAIGELIAATEAGPADSVQAEVDLVELRSRVAALQEILDGRSLENGEVPLASRVVEPEELPAKTSTANVAPSTEPIGVSSAPIGVAPAPVGVAPAPANLAVTQKVAFEADGFVADRSRLGRACWRGGRYQEGVAVLETLAGDPRSDYWRARCLEKLARNAEACDLYRHVIQIAGESPEGRSAREDLEFLEWTMVHGLVKP